MEWLISTPDFQNRDRKRFNFHPNQKCQFRVIQIEGKKDVRLIRLFIFNTRVMRSYTYSYRTRWISNPRHSSL